MSLSFSIIAILVGKKRYFVVVLSCISLMTNDAWHNTLSGYLVTSREECLFKLYYPFLKIGLSVSIISCKNFSYILDIRFFEEIWLANIFLLGVGLFHFPNGVASSVKAFNEVLFINFLLLSLVLFVSYVRSSCLSQHHEDLLLCFLLRVLYFQPLHLGLWWFWVKLCVSCEVVTQHHLSKEYSFPTEFSWHFRWKATDRKC